MKRIAVLGCTGSIGRQTLSVIETFSSDFRVVGLAGGRNVELLLAQMLKFGPDAVWVADDSAAARLDGLIQDRGVSKPPSFSGPARIEEFLAAAEPDLVVSAVSGRAGLVPTVACLQLGLDVALANKESLVMAGPLLKRIAAESGARIIPVDSEHSAIMQCMAGESPRSVRRIILTASGGPFVDASIEELGQKSFAESLRHPVWQMGEKISVDSATLMNKGLEVIEACVLFDLIPGSVSVLIHRECIVHSLVEFTDGSIKAQLGVADMRLPILYALCAPERISWPQMRLDISKLSSLHFQQVDTKRFRCLEIAYLAAEQGGSMPAVMSVADEVAVDAFRQGAISFLQIPEVVEATMRGHEVTQLEGLEDVFKVSRWAYQTARTVVRQLAGAK